MNKWTAEEVSNLIRLSSQGVSAKQIAARLGGKSRNAVVSKLKRLGTAGKNLPRAASQREGQQSFRQKVLASYGFKCSITGSEQLETLEAAHIKPFSISSDHSIENSLCLRSDIHALLDFGLISVCHENFTVQISRRVNDGDYLSLAAIKVSAPIGSKVDVFRKNLKWHNENVFLLP